jgi:hypothetical protein
VHAQSSRSRRPSSRLYPIPWQRGGGGSRSRAPQCEMPWALHSARCCKEGQQPPHSQTIASRKSPPGRLNFSTPSSGHPTSPFPQHLARDVDTPSLRHTARCRSLSALSAWATPPPGAPHPKAKRWTRGRPWAWPCRESIPARAAKARTPSPLDRTTSGSTSTARPRRLAPATTADRGWP